MQKYQEAVVNTTTGKPISGASVTVKTLLGVTATIYSGNGSPTTANPLTTDDLGRFSFYAADGRYTLSITGTGISGTTTITDILLEDPADGSSALAASGGAALIGFTQSGTGAGSRDLQTKVREMEVTPQDYVLTVGDAGPAFRRAIAAIKANGGGRLKVPLNTYTFAVATEADSLLIDFSNFKMDVDPGTVFKWGFYGLPLIPIIGANDVEIGNIRFIWTGTRGASPASGTHYGYAGNSVISNAEWCSHICVGGSNRVRLHNLSWEGLTTANNLENGIALWSGTAAGATGAVDVTGNVIEEIISNDVYIGVIAHGQDKYAIRKINSDRYISASAYIGPGHVIYISNCCTNGNIEEMVDVGTAIDSIPVGAGSTSYQFKGLQSSTVSNLKSKRVTGFGNIQATAAFDCVGNTFEDFYWEADRVADEAALTNGSVMAIANADTSKLWSRNTCRNWLFHDKKNTAAARSSDCSIIAQNGNTYRATNATDNIWENIKIIHSPVVGYSHTICQLFGQRSDFDISYFNYGTAVKTHFFLSQDDVTRPSDDNTVRLRIGGLTVDPNYSISGTRNHIIVETRSVVANAGTVAAGNISCPEIGTFTPVLTFATPGNLSVAYSRQIGRYTRNGDVVDLFVDIVTSTFTHTTASGSLQITGSPFTALSISNFTQIGIGAAWQGITKANWTHVYPFILANTAIINLGASGSAQSIAVIAPADTPTGGTVQLSFTMRFKVQT